MSRDTAFFNLIEALRQRGCALCRLGGDAVGRYLDGILYENVNDVDIQKMLKASHGLCSAHSEVLLRKGNSLGTAILYLAILRHLEQELPQEGPNRAAWLERLVPRDRSAADVLDPHAPCPACKQRDDAARYYLKLVQTIHHEAEFRDALQRSDPLCLPHLQQALLRVSGEPLGLLLEQQRASWVGLQAELEELIRKNDYRFRDEVFGAERDSWQRAVRSVVGEPDVF